MSSPPIPRPRARHGEWRTVAWIAVGLLAASQLRLVMWVALQGGVGADVTRSVLAGVAAVVFIRVGGRARPCAVPGGPRHRYRGLEGLNACVLGWAWATFTASALGVLVRWLANPRPLHDQAVAAGAGTVESIVAVWNGALAPALAEEFVFRYLLLGLLLMHMSTRRAVVVQAVAFGVAHTAVGVGGGLIAVGASYPLDAALHTFIFGILFGYLVVELGSIWPAIAVHAVGNALVTLDLVAGWLVSATSLVVAVVLMVGLSRGVMGMQLAVRLPTRTRFGVNVVRQRRLLCWVGPLFGTAAELRRPLAWIVPGRIGQRPAIDDPAVGS